ncbi:MAG: helix-turn-helix domain-containing protein, partial [Candidatus Dormibacteria bacterium]
MLVRRAAVAPTDQPSARRPCKGDPSRSRAGLGHSDHTLGGAPPCGGGSGGDPSRRSKPGRDRPKSGKADPVGRGRTPPGERPTGFWVPDVWSLRSVSLSPQRFQLSHLGGQRRPRQANLRRCAAEAPGPARSSWRAYPSRLRRRRFGWSTFLRHKPHARSRYGRTRYHSDQPQGIRTASPTSSGLLWLNSKVLFRALTGPALARTILTQSASRVHIVKVVPTRIHSVRRSVEVVLAVAQLPTHQRTASAVARLVQAPLPTVSHTLSTLVDSGLLVKDPGRCYQIGPAATPVAEALHRQTEVPATLMGPLKSLADCT